MCTLTRRLPKKSAPVNAAGLESASEAAKRRWEADNFAFQVYQYEDRFLLFNAVGDWRVPSVLERETLMGFDSGYTAAALPTKPSKEEAMSIRCSVLGNSFHVFSISFLFTHLLSDLYGCPLNLPLENYCWRDSLEALVNEPFSYDPSVNDDPMMGQQLVYEYLRRAEKGGSDVRLDLQAPFRPELGQDQVSNQACGTGKLSWVTLGNKALIVTSTCMNFWLHSIQ